MEIAENLHRAELAVAERDEHISEWVRLTAAKQSDDKAETVSAEVRPKPGRPEGGVRAAARELGLKRTNVQQALKVASISPEAKEAAKAAGLDDDAGRRMASTGPRLAPRRKG